MITEFILRRKVFIGMLFLSIVLLFIYIFPRIRLEFYPEIKYPYMRIDFLYHGMDPGKVLETLTIPVEEELSTVQGVDSISSTTGNEKMSIELWLNPDIDMELAELRIKQKLKNIDKPRDIYGPIISEEKEEKRDFFIFYLTSDDKDLIEEIERRILSTNGVKKVEIIGRKEKIIVMEPLWHVIKQYGLSFTHILDEMRTLLHERAGKIGADYGYLTSSFSSLQEFKEMPLFFNDGNIIRISEIFKVYYMTEKPPYEFRIDGKDALTFKIVPSLNASLPALSKRLKNLIAEYNREKKNIIITLDRGEEIEKEIVKAFLTMVITLIILFLIVMIFEKNFSMPLFVSITGVISVMLTLLIMFFSSFSVNILTISGMILGLGLLVDASIIYYQNVFRLLNEKKTKREAILLTADEIFLPLLSSAITTLIVFLPFLYIKKEFKFLYMPFVVALIISLSSSLLITYLFTPHIIMLLSIKRESKKFHKEKTEKFFSFFIKHRIFTSLFSLFIFLVSLFLFITRVYKKEEIIESFREPSILMTVRPIERVKTEEMREIAERVESIIEETGKGRLHTYTYLYPDHLLFKIPFTREDIQGELPLIIRMELEDLAGTISSADIEIRGVSPQPYTKISRGAVLFPLELFGYDYDRLIKISKNIAERMEKDEWIDTVIYNYNLIFSKLDRFSIILEDSIPSYIYHGGTEYIPGRINIGGEDFKLKIGNNIEKTLIEEFNPEFKIGKTKTEPVIKRRNLVFTNRIGYSYTGPGNAFGDFLQSFKNSIEFPSGFGFVERVEEEKIRFGEFERAALLSLLFIFIVLAIFFNSIKIPFLIIISIPFSFVGISFAYYITGEPFDTNALIGTILALGIVVNDAILLVSHIENLKKKGIHDDIILKGILNKKKAILLTSLTTIGAAIPFLFYPSTEVWHRFALSLISSLTTSTIAVLIFLPAWLKIAKIDKT